MNPFLASSSVVPGDDLDGHGGDAVADRGRVHCPDAVCERGHRPPRRHRRRRHPAGRRPRARPGGRRSLRRARRGVCGNDVAARRPDRHRPARRRGAPLHLGNRGGVATEQRRPDRLADRLRRRGVRQGQGVLLGRHDLRQGRRARHRVPGPHARRRRDVGGRHRGHRRRRFDDRRLADGAAQRRNDGARAPTRAAADAGQCRRPRPHARLGRARGTAGSAAERRLALRAHRDRLRCCHCGGDPAEPQQGLGPRRSSRNVVHSCGNGHPRHASAAAASASASDPARPACRAEHPTRLLRRRSISSAPSAASAAARSAALRSARS